MWRYDSKVFGLKVSLDQRHFRDGRPQFRDRFPTARTILIDRDLGERLLLSEDPLRFLLDLYDSARV